MSDPPDPTRVLVVDDEIAVQTSLRAFLEDEGFDVLSAGSAADALNWVSTRQIHVIIVDLRLGELGGEELIVRARSIQPPTRFLIYTGSFSYRVSERMAGIGLTRADVLYKPLRNLKTLADAIRRLTPKENGTCPKSNR